MKSKSICFCIPGRKQKEGKEGSSKSHRSRKTRELDYSAGAGNRAEANYEGGATTSNDGAAGMAAVMISTAATMSAIHGSDSGSAHGGGGGSAHGGGGDGGGGG